MVACGFLGPILTDYLCLQAIQAAVDYARENYQIVFFPEGEYVVSDTIVARAVPRAMAAGHIPGPKKPKGASDDFLLDGVSSRYVPNYLTGSRLGKGATITLKPSSPGFTDAEKPAYVFDFFFENSAGEPEPNAQYNSMATSLTIVIGAGNVGAVGIRLRGAQGSGIEDVTVYAGDGLAGVVGGCGSGGAHHGLRVIGGRYGLDLRQSQPAGHVSGATLEGQRCAGLIYGGFETLSAVGMNITDQRGCFGVVSTDVTGAGGNTTYYLPGAPREACSLPVHCSSIHASHVSHTAPFPPPHTHFSLISLFLSLISLICHSSCRPAPDSHRTTSRATRASQLRWLSLTAASTLPRVSPRPGAIPARQVHTQSSS